MRVKRWLGLFLVAQLAGLGTLLAEQVRVPAGTPVQVRLKADLLSDRAQEGDTVQFEVAAPVIIQGLTVIPAGAVAWGAVQAVKEGKYIRFDVQGVRLPNLREIKLRSVREKTKNPAKDVIKVEKDYGDTVGTPRGSQFTAYTGEDFDAEATTESPAPAAAVAAPVAAPTPANTVTSAPAPASAPAASAVAPPPPAAAPAAPAGLPTSGEMVTVECFSDPSGADILVDGEFLGTTNSILKIPVGTRKLELQLAGYNEYTRRLDLSVGMGVQTIRVNLETKP